MKNCAVSFVLFVLVLFGGWNMETAMAQYEMETAECFQQYEGENLHEQWMKSSPQDRLKLVEQIGEDGADRVCNEKGWSKLLGKEHKTSAHSQGFDQVWKSADGRIHVVEAKGGSSTVDWGYGCRQGTPEWAVKAAEKTLGNHAATEMEKEAARTVLKAASEGKLSVHVIRTEHLLGQPGRTVWESMSKCTPEATNLAKTSLNSLHGYSTDLTVPTHTSTSYRPTSTSYKPTSGYSYEYKPSTSTSYKPSTSYKAPSSTYKPAVSAAKTTAKTGEAVSQTGQVVRTVAEGAAVVAVAADVGFRGYEAFQTEQMYQNGQISNHERVKSHVQNGAGWAGGMTGAVVGAETGAATGAAIGSVVPLVGTAIGGAVGGICGGIGGYFLGDKAASAGAGAAVDACYK